jgi:hypothetical protein
MASPHEAKPAGRHNQDPHSRDSKGDMGKRVFPQTPEWILERDAKPERPD